MMFVGEFNTDKISFLLLGICINNDNEKINSETKSILKKELVEYKPKRLLHAYTYNEFKTLLKKYKSDNKQIKLREIIPNNYGVGLVREVGFAETSLDELLASIMKKFKYYTIVLDEKTDDCFLITYNPDIKNLKKIKLKLKEDTSVNCTTVQAGKNIDIKREFEMLSNIESEDGTLIVYDIDIKDERENNMEAVYYGDRSNSSNSICEQ